MYRALNTISYGAFLHGGVSEDDERRGFDIITELFSALDEQRLGSTTRVFAPGHATATTGSCPSNGLPRGPHPQFEIDHLIPLGVGGADGDHNLWPEPRRSVEPVWNAEAKDRLEWKLRDMVCGGAIRPAEAQAALTEDWTEAYRKYVSDRR